jgi:hypothetical protein
MVPSTVIVRTELAALVVVSTIWPPVPMDRLVHGHLTRVEL